MHKLIVIFAAAVVTACASTSGNQGPGQGASVDAPPVRVTAGVLTNSTGMTLYTYDRDVPGSGKSACTGTCAFTWPPLLATPDAKSSGKFNVIAREGGQRQWAYKGKPLYLFSGDTEPGDNRGSGVNGVWKIAMQ